MYRYNQSSTVISKNGAMILRFGRPALLVMAFGIFGSTLRQGFSNLVVILVKDLGTTLIFGKIENWSWQGTVSYHKSC